jgi:hypothetical protein
MPHLKEGHNRRISPEKGISVVIPGTAACNKPANHPSDSGKGKKKQRPRKKDRDKGIHVHAPTT